MRVLTACLQPILQEAIWKPEKYAPEAEPEHPSRERLEAAGQEELEELQDDLGDDRFLEEYRVRRLAELKAGPQKSAPQHGSYDEISRSEFVPRVTNAPPGVWVVLHLYSDELRDCAIMDACLKELATRHTSTRFLRINSTACIPGYPDANLPTIIIYRDGKSAATIARLEKFGGEATSPDLVELALNSVGDVCGDDDPASTAARVAAILEQAAKRKEEQERREEDARADD